MAGLDLGTVPDWLNVGVSLCTMAVAVFAYTSWRDQLRHGSKYVAAANIAERARLTRYHFYDARNPFYGIVEFPPWYRQVKDPTDAQIASAFAHIFSERWKLVQRQMLALANLRAKAGALLGEDVARRLEEYARKTRELSNFFNEKVAHLRAGQHIVAQWPDQQWVARVEAAVIADPTMPAGQHEDAYSKEFEERFRALSESLAPFL